MDPAKIVYTILIVYSPLPLCKVPSDTRVVDCIIFLNLFISEILEILFCRSRHNHRRALLQFFLYSACLVLYSSVAAMEGDLFLALQALHRLRLACFRSSVHHGLLLSMTFSLVLGTDAYRNI